MRLRPERAAAMDRPTGPDDAVIIAVDAALAFVAGQRWVRPYDAATALESVRDVAMEMNASERVQRLVESALAGYSRDAIPAMQLTDTLLDIRNFVRRTGATGGAQ
jgi:hypothetical protein